MRLFPYSIVVIWEISPRGVRFSVLDPIDQDVLVLDHYGSYGVCRIRYPRSTRIWRGDQTRQSKLAPGSDF